LPRFQPLDFRTQVGNSSSLPHSATLASAVAMRVMHLAMRQHRQKFQKLLTPYRAKFFRNMPFVLGG
jgi:hypothetical protein